MENSEITSFLKTLYADFCNGKYKNGSSGMFKQVDDGLQTDISVSEHNFYISVKVDLDDRYRCLEVEIEKDKQVSYVANTYSPEPYLSLKVWLKLAELLSMILGDNHEENS